MLRWRDNPAFDPKATNKSVNRLMLWIYSAFAFGLFARLLAIRPSKITALGVEFNVSNGDVIPGLFFGFVIGLTIILISYLLLFGFFYRFSNKANLRSLVYHAAATNKKFGKRKITFYTLKGKNTKAVKLVARLLFRFHAATALAIFFAPSLFVILFEREAVLAAVTRIIKNAN